MVAREGDDFGALDRDGGLQMRHGLAVAVGQSVFDGAVEKSLILMNWLSGSGCEEVLFSPSEVDGKKWVAGAPSQAGPLGGLWSVLRREC